MSIVFIGPAYAGDTGGAMGARPEVAIGDSAGGVFAMPAQPPGRPMVRTAVLKHGARRLVGSGARRGPFRAAALLGVLVLASCTVAPVAPRAWHSTQLGLCED